MQVAAVNRFATFNQIGQIAVFYRDDLNFGIPSDAIEITEELFNQHFDNTKPECQLCLCRETGQARLMTADEIKQLDSAQLKTYLAKLSPSELKLRELQLADPEGVAAAQRALAADNTLAAYARLAKEKRA